MTENLLIVDDDEIVCQVNKELLAQEGYQVAVAENGLVAWDMIENNPDQFDLILLDKNMPKLDGLSFLKRLKLEGKMLDLPVIMLTGDNEQQDIIEGLNEGAYYYLTKPAPAAILKQVVRNALDELRHKREMRAEIGQRSNGVRNLQRAEFSIRTIDEAKNLAIVLADASHDPDRTVSGYSELLINAVEHGNLGITYEEKGQFLREGILIEEIERRQNISPYSSRQVCVLVVRHKRAYTVTVTDEGEGFYWRKYLDFDPERAFDLHGRGIAMSKALSFDDIRYMGSGNSVVITLIAPKALPKATDTANPADPGQTRRGG